MIQAISASGENQALPKPHKSIERPSKPRFIEPCKARRILRTTGKTYYRGLNNDQYFGGSVLYL